MIPNNRITLSSVKYVAAMSEETPFFRAIVLFDGKPICLASNGGFGGANRYEPLKGQQGAQMMAALGPVDAWVKTLPPFEAYGTALTHDLDTVVGKALESHLAYKQMTKQLSSSILFTVPGQDRMMRMKLTGVSRLSPTQRTSLVASVRSKHPSAQILNNLPLEEALAIYLKRTDPAAEAQS